MEGALLDARGRGRVGRRRRLTLPLDALQQISSVHIHSAHSTLNTNLRALARHLFHLSHIPLSYTPLIYPSLTPLLPLSYPSPTPRAPAAACLCRINAQAGLEHPYCAQFRDPETEALASSRVAIPINDNTKKTTQHYRDACYEPATLETAVKDLRQQLLSRI